MCSSSTDGVHYSCIGKDTGQDQLSHMARLGNLHTYSNLECPCKVVTGMVNAAHAVRHSAEKSCCQRHPRYAEEPDDHSHLWPDCHEDQWWAPADRMRTWQDPVQGCWAV